MYDYAIIGGGIISLATAIALSERYPGGRLWEKRFRHGRFPDCTGQALNTRLQCPFPGCDRVYPHRQSGGREHRRHDTWKRRPRPMGRYVSTGVIPGNLLAEGTMFVHVGMITLEPNLPQFLVPDAMAFQVIDSIDGDSARGDWAGTMDGVIRPMLKWSTQYSPEGWGMNVAKTSCYREKLVRSQSAVP